MNPLHLPVYADKPQRRIPDAGGAIAVTIYRSKDGTVRDYVLFERDGTRLGDVSAHGRSLGRAAGYHEGHRSVTHQEPTWGNLTEAAIALRARILA